MRIENEPLILKNLEIKKEQNHLSLGPVGSKVPLILPKKFEPIIKRFLSGYSIKQTILELNDLGHSFHFHSIKQLLEILCERGWVGNPHIQEQAEKLKPRYQWRKSLLEAYSVSKQLFHSGPAAPITPLGFIIALSFIGLGIYGWGQVINSLTAVQGLLILDSKNLVPLLLIPIFFSIQRSLQHLIKFILLQISTGEACALKIKLDPLSLSLACELAPSNVPKTWFGTLSLLATLFLGSLTALISSRLPSLADYTGLIAFYSVLLILIDYSPFVKSSLTELLHYIYVRLEQSQKNQQNVIVESRIINLHVFSSFCWTFLFSLTIAWFLFHFSLNHFIDGLSTNDQNPIVVWGFHLLLLVLFFSFVDDMINSITYSGNTTRNLVHQYWRSEPAEFEDLSLSIDLPAAIESSPFLRNVDPLIRSKLLTHAALLRAPQHAHILKQGSVDRDLFILISGEVEVIRHTKTHRTEIVTKLASGSVFGETGFFLGKPRTADVIATSECQLLKIRFNKELFEASIDEQKSEVLKNRIWFLQSLVSSSLFRNIPGEALDSILFKGQIRRVPSNTTIIQENTPGDKCYFLIQGAANVTINGQLINLMKKGDMFGEIALLSNTQPRTASVITREESLIVELSRKDFWLILSENLPLALQIEKMASERFRNFKFSATNAS